MKTAIINTLFDLQLKYIAEFSEALFPFLQPIVSVT